MKPGGLHCARVVPQKARRHLRLICAGIEEKREDFHAFDLNRAVHCAMRSATDWSIDVETSFHDSLNLSMHLRPGTRLCPKDQPQRIRKRRGAPKNFESLAR